jgi:hypothetical protein
MAEQLGGPFEKFVDSPYSKKRPSPHLHKIPTRSNNFANGPFICMYPFSEYAILIIPFPPTFTLLFYVTGSSCSLVGIDAWYIKKTVLKFARYFRYNDKERTEADCEAERGAAPRETFKKKIRDRSMNAGPRIANWRVMFPEIFDVTLSFQNRISQCTGDMECDTS